MIDIKDKVASTAKPAIHKGYKPTFYYTQNDFFQTITEDEPEDHIHSSFIYKDGILHIFFYSGDKKIGELKMSKTIN